MPKEYNVDPIELDDNKEECKTCNKDLSKGQKGVIVLSFYMLGTSIYGTIILVKHLISLFQ